MAAILSALETVSYRHGGYAVPSSHIHDHDEDVCINIHDEVMMVTFFNPGLWSRKQNLFYTIL